MKGRTICICCGLEISSESDAFLIGEDRDPLAVLPTSRSPLLHNKYSNTRISSVNHDASGRRLSSQVSQRFSRLKRRDQLSFGLSSAEKREIKVLIYLRGLAERVGVKIGVIDEAESIFKRARREKLTNGISVLVVVSAVLFAACQTLGIPKHLSEIARESLASSKDPEIARRHFILAGRFYRRLMDELRLQPAASFRVAYVSRIAEALKISGKTQGFAIQILKIAKEKRFVSGKNPAGVAAAALYLAAEYNNERIMQKKLAKEASVSDTAVRNLAQALRKKVSDYLQQEGWSCSSQ
jgi:transcription initiation factor TFIIB